MTVVRRFLSKALSLLLACALFVTGLPSAFAAQGPVQRQTGSTGSIGVTLRFDLPQTAENASGRDIRLQISGSAGQTTISLPAGTAKANELAAGIYTEVKNVDGEALTTEERVGYYQAELTGLTAGQTYTVKLTGTGYKPFQTTVTLDEYSKHLIVGTGDGTFSLGDVNGDGVVDSADLDAMNAKLGQDPNGAGLSMFDLNGDGRLDVTDLSYINHNRGNAGQAQVLDTSATVPAVLDTSALTVSGGDADSLFQAEGTVTLSPAAGSGDVILPIQLASAVETSVIQITCPDGGGAIQAGQAEVELADGTKQTVAFDTSLPAGVHAIGRTAGARVVTIDLGKKVAVKKVTITVTATAGGTDYVTVTQVEFLKEIVPDSPKNNQAQILSAVPGDSSVTLEWAGVANVTGYAVQYWLSGNPDQKTSSHVNTTRTVISGLENLKTYQFQVTAVNGEWRGTPSAPVSATPEPGSVPGAPSNIQVTAADQSLRLSWGKTKDATFYQVFYRQSGQGSFTQFGGNVYGTSAAITVLTNGVTYQVAVKAGNGKGVGPFSATASGTPKQESLDMPDLPTDGRIDNSHVIDVVMTNPNNVDRSLCPNFAPKQVVDGSAATYWIAKAFWESMEFTYTFDQPQDMNYVIWVPYLQENYKYMMARYAVKAMDEEGNVISSGTYPAPQMTDKNYLVLTFPMVKGVKRLSISLAQVEGRSSVNIAEMAFYKSDTLADEIAALFADGSFSSLKSGVTADQIAALSARLEAKADFYLNLSRLQDELALAQALLSGQTDALGVVKADFQSRGGSQDSQYGQGGSALQPLGISAQEGATVAVYAQLPGDKPVYVVPTQFYGESGIWQGAPVQLVNGRNYITVPKIGSLDAQRGGPLYLTYAGSSPDQIKLQVRGDGNTFRMPILELSGWYDMSETARRETIRSYVTQLETYVGSLNSTNLQLDVRNATEVSTPSVLLSIPADRALAGLKGVNRNTEEMVEAMYQNVLAWEDVLYVANQVQGIIPAAGARPDIYRYPMSVRQNIRYMRMFAGAFMYAAGNHVGVGYGSTSGLVCGKPASVTGAENANALFGWGIAHEIGHNMDKLGKAEITNNIYSLAIQAWDGASMLRPTRLTNSNIWAKIYDKTSMGRPGSAGNVFVQLGMYWQLHLAYDEADKPLDFFNRFFTAWKAKEYNGYTYDERVALIAAKTANRDLTQFFTRWGLTLGDKAKDILAGYPAETRALWYLNDDAYAYRLNNGAGFTGTISVSAQTEENKASLTITGGDDSILGYEIRRNGQPIGFTTEDSYTDNLGSANNLTYQYTAIPVDRLGNLGSGAAANEVRIAWDAAIDPSLYAMAQDGDAVTATMRDRAVAVTGVKITGTALSGTYTVEIKANAASQSWVKVKEGTLSGDSTVGYFTKPGADASDTRIWTYDAAAVRITGVPAGASVTLLDYPGDRVDFHSQAAVGKLKSDYRYGDGADDVIPAGTLVVLGTYRGDPAYNTVELEVRYSTAGEAGEAAETPQAGENDVVERAMAGYALLFAEIPSDGKVSDTSDGFWLFVPNMEQEKALNAQAGIPEMNNTPMEIRAVCRRYDGIDHTGTPRTTTTTLWISFPELDTLPEIAFTGEGVQ